MTTTDLDIDALALRIIAEKAILDVAKTMHEDTKAAVREAIRHGERLAAVAADGTSLGFVQLTNPKAAGKVTDPDALLEWVEVNHPDEVEVVETVIVRRVRSSFAAALAKAGGITPDGEVVPGVEMVQAPASLRIMPNDEAKELAAESIYRLPRLRKAGGAA